MLPCVSSLLTISLGILKNAKRACLMSALPVRSLHCEETPLLTPHTARYRYIRHLLDFAPTTTPPNSYARSKRIRAQFLVCRARTAAPAPVNGPRVACGPRHIPHCGLLSPRAQVSEDRQSIRLVHGRRSGGHMVRVLGGVLRELQRILCVSSFRDVLCMNHSLDIWLTVPYPFLTQNPFNIRVAIYVGASTFAALAFMAINALHP